MSISLATRQAYSEIDEFLKIISPEEREKVPQKLRDIFRDEKDNNYKKVIDATVPISEQDLKEETLSIIALLNLQYWCQDENEKERLKQMYNENEQRYQEELKEKYNPDNLFKNNKKIDEQVQENVMLPMDYSNLKWYQKIFNRITSVIKEIFHHNK